MRLLDQLITDAQTDAHKRTRKQWTEADYQVALDQRLTGVEAANILGCTPQTVNTERREWKFEWN